MSTNVLIKSENLETMHNFLLRFVEENRSNYSDFDESYNCNNYFDDFDDYESYDDYDDYESYSSESDVSSKINIIRAEILKECCLATNTHFGCEKNQCETKIKSKDVNSIKLEYPNL